MESYKQLEIKWAEFNDLDPERMVVCSSGTAALHLGMEALSLPLGSKVIVPDFTMVACPRAVVLAGLTPIFIDCHSGNLLMNFDKVLATSSYSREIPSALMAVHVYGRRCNMEWFDGMEEDQFTKQKTYLIEDLAEAHGVKPYRQTDVACWSFYKNKIVAGEEGGAVWFKDPDHAKLARQLRSLGFTDAHDFDHIPRGHNYRLANSLADLVLEGLDYAFGGGGPEHWGVTWRREVEARYHDDCPNNWRMPSRQTPWVYDIRIPGMTSTQQDAVVQALQKEGIEARHSFKPMTSLREFRLGKGIDMGIGKGLPNALAASREVIYLPLTKYHPQAFPIIRQVLGK